MKVSEIKAKSIIVKSNIPDTDYVINPYVGCSNGCIYCYARFMKRFTRHEEKWGEFVDVKTNGPELVDKFNFEKLAGKSIFLSSVTDPYNQVEKEYGMTRKILERLLWQGREASPGRLCNIGIQTKSELVLKDVNLFKKMKGRGIEVEVGFTLTTLDDKIREEIEPGCSSVENRIEALKELKKEGIGTYVFVGPVLPRATDWQGIVNKTKGFVDFYYFENLTIRGSIWADVKKWLVGKHPEWLDEYERIYFSKNDYWDRAEEEVKRFGTREGLEFRIAFHHTPTNLQN